MSLFIRNSLKLVGLSILLLVSANAQHDEHEAVLNLADAADATHTAVVNGRWFDATTWSGGRVPDANARVYIPEGIRVTYQGVSSVPLKTLRIDGTLFFAYWRNTRVVVDTILVSHEGTLIIGDRTNPIGSAFTAEIQFADNGDIDTDWDTELLSRGLVSLGRVNIYGSKKDSFLKVAQAPMAGANRLILSRIPENWQVGDTIVITGTHKRGYDVDELRTAADSDWRGTEDEVVTITEVNDNEIIIDRPLQYDHDTPASDLRAYVANLSRNVVFSNEGGRDLPVHQRGHVMLMNSDSDVRYAEFDELGRTDKSVVSAPVETFDPVDSTSNAQGRYAIHLHRTGITSCGRALGACDCLQSPIYLVGNAVNGSPGWGMVQHSANANFTENVVYNAFGASFVAESGNDVGNWLRNIAIKSRGVGWGILKAQDTVVIRDAARTGDGFWFSSRLVEASENVAANTTHGYSYVSRTGIQADGSNDLLEAKSIDQPETVRGGSRTRQTTPNIPEFRDNEAFGNQTSFQAIRNAAAQNHDLRSVIKNFTAWESFRGVIGRYSPHYTLINLRLIGTNTPHPNTDGPPVGVVFERKAFDWTINGADIENFEIGVKAAVSTRVLRRLDFRVGMNFIDMSFTDVDQHYTRINSEGHFFHDSSDLVPNRLAVSYRPIEPIGFGEDRDLDWLKVDSIGVIDRVWEFDRANLDWNRMTSQILNNDGYYRDVNGEPFIVVEDLVADRATGDMEKLLLPISLNFTDAELSRYDDNGRLTFEAPAPVALGDQFRIQVDTPQELDLIGNDHDPDGGRIWLSGTIQPTYGDLFLSDDNKVLYVPDIGYSGDDFFSYWVRDEEGNLTRGEVSLRVGSGAIPEVKDTDFFEPANFVDILNDNIRPLAIQNREAIPTGETTITVDPVENDHDINGDELFLTTVHRGLGIAAIDIRLDNEGVVTATTSSTSASGGVEFFYAVSDGDSVDGADDGYFPIFIGRNNARTAPGQEMFGPNIGNEAGSYLPYRIEGPTGSIEHLGVYGESELSRIRVESDDYEIGSVAFYVNGVLERTDNNPPFMFVDADLEFGENVLRIVATSESNQGGFFLFDDRKKIQMATPIPPLVPVADSFVRGGRFGDINYGADSVLTTKMDDRNEDFERRSYLRFDVPRFSGSDVVSATLRLRAERSNLLGDIHSVYAVSDDSWGETAITWNNRPDLGSFLNSSPVPDIDGWFEVDVTDFVQTELGNDGIVSFAVESEGQELIRYHSREASTENQPQLIIETLAGSVPAAPSYPDWVARNGLTGRDRRALATPNNDGIPNLLKYAFNIEDVYAPPARISPGQRQSGLPNIFLSNGVNKRLRVSFIRNKNDPTLTYRVQFSSTLRAGDWSELGREISVSSINSDWERVVVQDNFSTATANARFGRVLVEQN